MEDTHGAEQKVLKAKKLVASLNPYYNGRYSWSLLFSLLSK